MDFHRIMLGYNEMKSLESLLIKEKVLIKQADDFEHIELDSQNTTRVNNKSTLYRILLLFEEFDSNILSLYDNSPLIDCGILSPKSIYASNGQVVSIAEERIRELNQYRKNTVKECKSFILDALCNIDLSYSIDVFSCIRPSVINLLAEALFNSDFQTFERRLMKYIFPILNERFELLLTWSGEYSRISDMIDFNDNYTARKVINAVLLHGKKFMSSGKLYNMEPLSELLTALNVMFRPVNQAVCDGCFYRNSLDRCYEENCQYSSIKHTTSLDLYMSMNFNIPLYNTILKSDMKQTKDVKMLDDIYYLVNVKLQDKLNCLPTPTSFREVIRLRSNPAIKSFREAFSRWCEHMCSDDTKTIELIQKDFDLARNIMLKHHSSIENNTSIINCVLKIIGNQIPYFANILGTIFPLIEMNSAKDILKHEWFVLTR